MKKLPCLFVRTYTPRANGRGTEAVLTRDITPGLEWALQGLGIPTVKYDGTACMVKDGRLYKRYDAKAGKTAPEGAIPCSEADPITGHHPHWIAVDDKPDSKWHASAFKALAKPLADGTYELCGPHFGGNPYGLLTDTFIPHGKLTAPPSNSFDELRSLLESMPSWEGIVWWKDGEPQCKIRRGDFGLPWPA